MWNFINLAKIKPSLFILACLTALWVSRPGLAQAQTAVEIGCDNGVGNVADLINNLNLANEDPDDQERFILGENCIYTLTAPTTVDKSGLLISADLVIEGNGATIRRKSSPLPPHFRLIKISGGAEVLLKDLILTDGHIVTGGGGAILAGQGSTVRLDEVQLRNNTAKFGGAIATLGGAGATIVSGSLFDNNQALGGGGGGIYTNSPLTISDGTTFTRNTARRDGGAISIDDRAVAVIEQSRFEQNQSLTEEGGGVYASGPLTVNQTEFISNTASLRGGGVNSAGNKTLIIESHFLRNQTNKYAGAFYTTSPQVEVSQSTFIQNSAAEEGGAIISEGKSVLSDNRFIKNKAFEGAGLILTSDETSHLVNNLWVDNESDPLNMDTVVIELVENGAVVMHHNTIVSRVPRNHGAVGIVRGELQAHNNIVVNYGRPLLPRPGSQTPPLVISTHNLFHGHTPDELTTGNSNIEADPLFVDPANGDFRLQANSPAIDKGLDVGVSIDLAGRPRPVGEGFDIGAYEFEPSTNPPDEGPTPEPQPGEGFTVYLPLVVK